MIFNKDFVAEDAKEKSITWYGSLIENYPNIESGIYRNLHKHNI